jgi:hypothetical protein
MYHFRTPSISLDTPVLVWRIAAAWLALLARRLTRIRVHRSHIRLQLPYSGRGNCKSRGEAMSRTAKSSLVVVAIVSLAVGACSGKPKQAAATNEFNPVYDKKTGKLTQLTFDADKDGKNDTWSYMDGTRIVRIEIDRDNDGRIDRWEYYGADQKVEKIGIASENDGKADAWAYPAADGSLAKKEISTKRDGKVTRVEYYEAGALVRVEEDTQASGRIDKWETYRNGSLSAVAFDDQRLGKPTRRLVYGADGQVRAEVDPQGSGTWTAAPAKQ